MDSPLSHFEMEVLFNQMYFLITEAFQLEPLVV